jgi:hypothetical protein
VLDGEAGDLPDRAADRASGLVGRRGWPTGARLLARTQGGNGNAPAMRAWQSCWAISQLTPLADAGSPASPRQIMASSAVSSRGVVRVATAGSRARQASSRRRTSGSSRGGRSSGPLAPTASMIAWPMSAQSPATTVRSSPRPARVALIRSRPTRAMIVSVAALSLTAIIR